MKVKFLGRDRAGSKSCPSTEPSQSVIVKCPHLNQVRAEVAKASITTYGTKLFQQIFQDSEV